MDRRAWWDTGPGVAGYSPWGHRIQPLGSQDTSRTGLSTLSVKGLRPRIAGFTVKNGDATPQTVADTQGHDPSLSDS